MQYRCILFRRDSKCSQRHRPNICRESCTIHSWADLRMLHNTRSTVAVSYLYNVETLNSKISI